MYSSESLVPLSLPTRRTSLARHGGNSWSPYGSRAGAHSSAVHSDRIWVSPWSHPPPPPPPPCGLFFTLATSSSSVFFLFHYYDDDHTTPHRMLKWVSCRSNSCLLNIVTTAEMTGEARWPTFIPAPIFGGGGVNIWRWLCDDLRVASRSPDGDPAAIDRFVDIDRRSPGALPGIGRSPGDGRRIEPGKTGRLQLSSADHCPSARRWLAGDRWASAQSCSRSGESADDLPMSKNRHPAKIGEKSGGHRRIYKACDVALSVTIRCIQNCLLVSSNELLKEFPLFDSVCKLKCRLM